MSKKPKKPTKRSELSEDETALWQRVAESITPMDALDRDADRVRVVGGKTPGSDDTNAARAPRSSEQQKNVPSAQTSKRPAPATQRTAQATEPQAPEPKGLGHTELRKLRSGRLAIEARLDLHGMRQGEAHGALRHFLYSSQQRGLRWVIVITGKGGRSARSDDSGAHFDGLGRHAEPGVLRRNVPHWLQAPDLRSIVIGFQTAGPQHGGEGALYINLRRRDRVK